MSKGVVTEVNESGNPVPPECLAELRDKVNSYAAKSQMMVFGGSAPQRVPVSIYRDLIELVNKYRVPCILDADDELLLQGLEAAPYLVKPNLYELEKATRLGLKTHREIVRAARTFLDKGVNIIGVSMGSRGAIIVDDKEAYYAPPIQVEVKGTAGAGDSMVSGFCLAIKDGAGVKEMLRYGMAAATASVMSEGTLLWTRAGFESILPRGEIEKIV